MRRLCAILAILCPACGLFAAYDMRNQPTAALDGWKIEAEAARPDAVCRSGETVEFRVRLLKDGRPAPGRKLVWSIHGDYARGAKGECVSAAEPVTLRFTPRGPGFTWLKVDCPLEAGRKIYARAGVMTDPETVRPGFAEPADFDAFWEEQKRAVRAGAIAPREVPLEVEEPYRGRFELFDVTVATPGTKPVRAYLTRPAGEPGRKFPAMVTWHAAGVRSAMPQYRFAGMGLLVLDVNAHGIGNGGSHEEYVRLYRTTMKDYRFEGADDREKIYFNGMYRRLIRALDYLQARPDWDGRTLIVYGGSQGGAQALAAAGLDPAVTAVIAHEPAMCDHGAPLAGRTAGWPRFIRMKGGKPADPAVARAVAYYDSAFFAARIRRAECLVLTGFIDTTCVPSSVYAAFNSIPSASKRIVNFPQAIHGSYPEFDRVTDEFLAGLLRPGK